MYEHSAKLTYTYTSSTAKNHVVYMDNFFTSVKPAEDLEAKQTFCVGTIRTNKLHAISELCDQGTLRSMERGDYICKTKGSITITVWKDNNLPHFQRVPCVRRRHRSEEEIGRWCSGADTLSPALPGYNQCMGGVDHNDQNFSYYAINRKSRRWWLRIFYHFLDVAVVNAHCLYLENRQRAFHPPLLTASTGCVCCLFVVA